VSSRRVVAVLRKLPLSRGVISVRGRGEHKRLGVCARPLSASREGRRFARVTHFRSAPNKRTSTDATGMSA
jgi:hypothetical protein